MGQVYEPDAVDPESFAEEAASFVTQALRRDAILGEVCVERLYQDGRWGGPEHDDTLSEDVWRGSVIRYAAADRDFRTSMLKVAALAVAAVESHDRRSGRG